MQNNGDTKEKKSPSHVRAARRVERSQQEQMGDATTGESVCAEQLLSSSPELARRIKLAVNDLKIRPTDRSWAAEVVNDFQEKFLKFLRSSTDQPIFQSAEFLNTGSYFEKVKINNPDEFDMMLKLYVTSRFNITPLDDGLFYRIDLLRATQRPIKAFLLEGELTLSSSKVLAEMFRLVRKFLKTYKVPDAQFHWEVNRKNPYSPAVTLSLYRTKNKSGEQVISADVVPALEVPSWPSASRSGPNVDKWLGKKVRQEIRSFPCYYVPKRSKVRNLGEEAKRSAKESWRISFSHIEKRFIALHGNKKTCCESKSTRCCRKQCLMLLKSLIERLKLEFPKQLEALCSYHGKTAFLHTLASRSSDSEWARQDLPVCFIHLVDALEDHASRRELPHFFIPECNLFSPAVFPRSALACLVSALQEQKKAGMPLLKPPAPIPALQAETVSAETFVESVTESSSSPSWATFVDFAAIAKIIAVLVLVCSVFLFRASFLGR